MNDIVNNKYIRATSKEHGARIIQFLVENGGRNEWKNIGREGIKYFITNSGFIDCFDNFKPEGYTEMFLPEDEPKEELKRGDLVEVSFDESVWRDSIFLAEIEFAEFPFVTVFRGDEEKFNSGQPFGIYAWKHCRKVETITREEAEKQLGKRIVD